MLSSTNLILSTLLVFFSCKNYTHPEKNEIDSTEKDELLDHKSLSTGKLIQKNYKKITVEEQLSSGKQYYESLKETAPKQDKMGSG